MPKTTEKEQKYVYKIYIETFHHSTFMVRMTFVGLEDLVNEERRWVTAYKYMHDPEPNQQILLFINRIRYIKLLGKVEEKK